MGETLLGTTGAGGSLTVGSNQSKCSVKIDSMRQGRRRFGLTPDTLPTTAVLALGQAQTTRRRTGICQDVLDTELSVRL
jgi:hypothetical protein